MGHCTKMNVGHNITSLSLWKTVIAVSGDFLCLVSPLWEQCANVDPQEDTLLGITPEKAKQMRNYVLFNFNEPLTFWLSPSGQERYTSLWHPLHICMRASHLHTHTLSTKWEVKRESLHLQRRQTMNGSKFIIICKWMSGGSVKSVSDSSCDCKRLKAMICCGPAWSPRLNLWLFDQLFWQSDHLERKIDCVTWS